MPCVPCVVVIEGCGRVNGAARRLITANLACEDRSFRLEGSCDALIEAIEAFADVTEKLLGCDSCYRLNPLDVAKIATFCERDLRDLASSLNSAALDIGAIDRVVFAIKLDDFIENLLTMSYNLAKHAAPK